MGFTFEKERLSGVADTIDNLVDVNFVGYIHIILEGYGRTNALWAELKRLENDNLT